jgi:hypothetical protein
MMIHRLVLAMVANQKKPRERPRDDEFREQYEPDDMRGVGIDEVRRRDDTNSVVGGLSIISEDEVQMRPKVCFQTSFHHHCQ